MKTASVGVTVVFIVAGALPVFAQEDETPPVIESVTWEIARNTGGDPFWGPFEAFVSFDPTSEIAREGDWISLTVVVSDAGLPEDEIFVRKQSEWWPLPTSLSPEPPPIDGDTPNFVAPWNLLISETTAIFLLDFIIPEWEGANQARLRGQIDWDVRWLVTIEVCNEEDPDEQDTPIAIAAFPLYAVEQPAFGSTNPPPFADAGADRTVPAGLEVILDGSRTYDNYNVGFDVQSENVFEKDELTFTWEWMSGPVRVDPVQTDPTDPIATVVLDIPNDPSDPNDLYYEYRLLVDDNVNALPSTDTVRITVVEELPEKNPPVAIIEGPASARPVGSIITLVSRSYDPDRPDDPNGVLLEYRWQQTNELGGPLDPDELQNAFQPLGGMTEKTSSWQALTAGTFYFRLLVDDDDFRSNAQFSVEVIDTETDGVTETADGSPSDGGATGESGAGEQGLTGSAGCGAGILPLAVAPLAMCVLRRRR